MRRKSFCLTCVGWMMCDERETLHNAIRETVIAWEEYGGNIERMLKARLYGFRPPVVPVPVYEYGRMFDGIVWSENEYAVHLFDWLWDAPRMRRIPEVLTGPASEWEPVGVDKPRRFSSEQRANLIDFARHAIQAVWDDAGPTTAEVLAGNVVLAQEFAWLSMHFPVAAVPVEPESEGVTK